MTSRMRHARRYILSADLAKLAARRAAALPKLPAIEDALLGTLVEDAAVPTSRPAAFRHRNRDDYAVRVCAEDTEFVLLHKLDQAELGKCRAATQRRRSAACPGGPCVCRNLGRKMKRPRKVLVYQGVGGVGGAAAAAESAAPTTAISAAGAQQATLV